LTATATFTLTVSNVAPTASITGAPATGHSPEGTTLNLGSSVTDPSPADTAAGFTYHWSMTKNGVEVASWSAADFPPTAPDPSPTPPPRPPRTGTAPPPPRPRRRLS